MSESTQRTTRPIIGVRDSGVGGLTVARRILAAVPDARLLYFADTAHVPYGDKTPEQVRHYALSISQFLIEKGAQSVVFACNTTSAYALDTARERFEVPIFGVIEPGARLATLHSRGKIGVLATAATVASGVYTRELHRLNPELEVQEVGCPAFVPLIEAERTDSVEAFEACRHYLAPLLRSGVDTVVLGCTHFPLLLPALQEVAPHVCFIDPAEGVALDIAAQVGKQTQDESTHSFFKQQHHFWVSGEQIGVANWIRKLLHIPCPILQTGPSFD